MTASRSALFWRGKVGSLSRSRIDSDPELVQARQECAVASILDRAERRLAETPPLTSEQSARLLSRIVELTAVAR